MVSEAANSAPYKYDLAGGLPDSPLPFTRVAYRLCARRSVAQKEEFSGWMDTVCQNEQVPDAVIA